MFNSAFWLTVIFAVLKILGLIDWSWLTVSIPMICFFVFWVLIIVFAILIDVKNSRY